jgi:hypothetical protein
MALRAGTKTITKTLSVDTKASASEAGSGGADEAAPALATQRKRPELGQYHVQVDRQTKASYATPEAAEAAAIIIKKGHPVVQVVVYDTANSQRKLIELPKE